jgi:aspartyl-tRNA(Asn)/glutamyl-tRNA(Gln) amidotransferase subunit A
VRREPFRHPPCRSRKVGAGEAMTNPPLSADASAHHEALARGDASAVGLATHYLEAIEAAQASINAYIAIDRERTLAEARASDAHRAAHGARPLEGLAIAIKDNLDAAGWRTTAGMGTRRDAPVAQQDSAAVARLRAAGAVILGKLNLHEAALGADNDNPHFGACHHPRRHGVTPGGSSGGSGAAVAGALCSAALGTDSMGSVRIPASYCGVFGLKPTYGAISPRGSVVVSRRLDHVGVLARSARDLGLLLPVLAGFDPACAESRAVAFAAPAGGRLRIGVPALDGIEVQPAVREAFARGLDALRARGHAVVDLPGSRIEPGRARRAGLLVCEAEMLVEHAADWAAQRERFSPALAKMLAWAAGKSAADFAGADRVLDEAAVQLQQWLSDCDLLAWPATPQVAFAFGTPVPANQADLTCFANMAGVPALSLPLPVGAGEWPVGMQLIGRGGDDLRLVALAHELTA